MRVSLALVGIGKIARDQHIPSIRKTEGVSLAATASRNPDATVDDLPAYPSLSALLENEPDITAVSLATPPAARFGDAALAINAGKHVMLEKPPGTTLSEVETLAEMARTAGVTLFATWHSREAAAIDTARDWLKGKYLKTMQITWIEDVRKFHPGQDWIWQAGGLGVFDPGINALSVMTALLSEPVHLSAATLDFPANRETPIAAQLAFTHPGDAEISATFDWRHDGPPDWRIDLDTGGGAARLDNGGRRFTSDDGVVAGEDEEYHRLYQRFAELIVAGESDVDLSPMRHVADAFTLGRRVVKPEFHWSA